MIIVTSVGIMSALSILMMTTFGQLSFAATATNNATLEKYFNACYTTVNSVLAQQSDPNAALVYKILLKSVSAYKVLPSYKADVIRNMTQPVHLQPPPNMPSVNMTSAEVTMSQIAQCMNRLR